MSTADREKNLVAEKTDLDVIVLSARKLARRMGISFNYGDGSKLYVRAHISAMTQETVVDDIVAYPAPFKRP